MNHTYWLHIRGCKAVQMYHCGGPILEAFGYLPGSRKLLARIGGSTHLAVFLEVPMSSFTLLKEARNPEAFFIHNLRDLHRFTSITAEHYHISGADIGTEEWTVIVLPGIDAFDQRPDCWL